MKIYIASSWKNTLYETTRDLLRQFGYEIMDWRDEKGFKWNETTVIPEREWTGEYYRDFVLHHWRAVQGYNNDIDKMHKADCCVLLLPCGRSAHLEAGIFAGVGKPLHIYVPVFDTPELMYKAARSISFSIEELVQNLEQA